MIHFNLLQLYVELQLVFVMKQSFALVRAHNVQQILLKLQEHYVEHQQDHVMFKVKSICEYFCLLIVIFFFGFRNMQWFKWRLSNRFFCIIINCL